MDYIDPLKILLIFYGLWKSLSSKIANEFSDVQSYYTTNNPM